jgi:hypothetical protein
LFSHCSEDEGRSARVQLPGRSTATQQTSSSKSCPPGKTADIIHERPEKVVRPEGLLSETLRNELETHLKLLQRLNLISTWHDRKITAGAEWAGQIDRNLEAAEIILLLVSADFIASDYCYDKEMKRALERHEAGSARVILVILRDVDWHSAPFSKLQVLPKEGRPVTLWENKDSAWKDVALGIRKAVEEIKALPFGHA